MHLNNPPLALFMITGRGIALGTLDLVTYVHLTLKSRNAKVGPIPVSTSSAATCRDMCPLKAKGCYATFSRPLNLH